MVQHFDAKICPSTVVPGPRAGPPPKGDTEKRSPCDATEASSAFNEGGRQQVVSNCAPGPLQCWQPPSCLSRKPFFFVGPRPPLPFPADSIEGAPEHDCASGWPPGRPLAWGPCRRPCALLSFPPPFLSSPVPSFPPLPSPSPSLMTLEVGMLSARQGRGGLGPEISFGGGASWGG